MKLDQARAMLDKLAAAIRAAVVAGVDEVHLAEIGLDRVDQSAAERDAAIAAAEDADKS